MTKSYKIDERYHEEVAFFGKMIIKNVKTTKKLTQNQLGEIIGKKENNSSSL